MTAPTISEAAVLLALKLFGRGCFVLKTREAMEPVIQQALDDYAVKHANTLPLDEVPEGWRFESIELVMPLQGVPHYACRLTSFPEQHDDIYLTGATPAEALRAAIAKVTP